MPSDTSADAERVLVEGFRQMSATEKLARVVSMNRALQNLAAARLRAQYGEMSDREQRLRLAALRLDASVMRNILGWDPDIQGL